MNNRAKMKFLIALNNLDMLSLKIKYELLEREGDPETVIRYSRARWQAAGVRARSIDGVLLESEKRIAMAEQELDALKDLEVSLLPVYDTAYPQRLLDIYDPPILLYVLGSLSPKDSQAVAMVGSRVATPYGHQVCHVLTRGLAASGMTIVSGMAVGIDTLAHRGALESDGRTIAVLGSGLDVVYPPENYGLMKEIALHGAVVSEFSLGTKPKRFNFPRRNRIISGLALGTVVIEASERSGSLITAHYAADQGREVFAVPGSIFSKLSHGTNALISEGAHCIQTADDILSSLSITEPAVVKKRVRRKKTKEDTAVLFEPPTPEAVKNEQLEASERDVLAVLADTPHSIDDIIRASGMQAGRVESILMMLEIKGLAEQIPGKQFRRRGDAAAVTITKGAGNEH